mgnify:FL=1
MGWLGILVMCAAFAPLHDFHFSRTDFRWNPETRTVQTTLRVFTDDLEEALRNHHELGSETKIWLGDAQEWAGADSSIVAWLNSNLTLSLGGTALTWTWVGKEVELDISYLYLESAPIQGQGATWHISNRVFFNEFYDQVNEVHIHGVTADGESVDRREMLNWELPMLVWESAIKEENHD